MFIVIYMYRKFYIEVINMACAPKKKDKKKGGKKCGGGKKKPC